MIQNKTARRIMYEWHGGQSSAFYRAASSGLVDSWDELRSELQSNIRYDEWNDMPRLLEWINHKEKQSKQRIIVCGIAYSVLPWVSR